MADDNTSTAGDSQTTSGGDGKNTQDSQTGADTQAATTSTEGQQSQQQSQTRTDVDITQSPEFKAALTKAIEAKLPQLKRQVRKDIAKEVDGDEGAETKPTVETVSKERDDLRVENRTLKARDQLETFIADKRNNLQVRNVRGLFKYVKDDLAFDDGGNVTNFKDVLAMAKNEAGEFFGSAHGSADGGRGNGQVATMDMNTLIRGR